MGAWDGSPGILMKVLSTVSSHQATQNKSCIQRSHQTHYVQENGDSVGWVKFHFHHLSFDAAHFCVSYSAKQPRGAGICLVQHERFAPGRLLANVSSASVSSLTSQSASFVKVCCRKHPRYLPFRQPQRPNESIAPLQRADLVVP